MDSSLSHHSTIYLTWWVLVLGLNQEKKKKIRHFLVEQKILLFKSTHWGCIPEHGIWEMSLSSFFSSFELLARQWFLKFLFFMEWLYIILSWWGKTDFFQKTYWEVIHTSPKVPSFEQLFKGSFWLYLIFYVDLTFALNLCAKCNSMINSWVYAAKFVWFIFKFYYL